MFAKTVKRPQDLGHLTLVQETEAFFCRNSHCQSEGNSCLLYVFPLKTIQTVYSHLPSALSFVFCLSQSGLTGCICSHLIGLTLEGACGAPSETGPLFVCLFFLFSFLFLNTNNYCHVFVIFLVIYILMNFFEQF